MRKCCNCCRFAQYEEHGCTIRRSRKSKPQKLHGFVLCCKDGYGYYGNKTYLWVNKPCSCFKYDPLKIVYDVESDQYYLDWIEAQMARLNLTTEFTLNGEELKPSTFYNSFVSLRRRYNRYRKPPKKK